MAGAVLLLLACPHAARSEPPSAPGQPNPSPALPVKLTIDSVAPGRPVPARFLGLSFEAAALAQLGGYADRGDLVALLRSLGPGVLRFGGITADEDVAWSDGSPPPPWATSTIGPAQLTAIGRLARRSGWRVLLTVGLAHYEPQAAAQEVAVARRALGPYLLAVEIGNEPEAYANHGYRPQPWLPQEYEEEVSDYREAIEALSPGVPIAGPDSSGSASYNEWGYAEALAQAPVLLTGHHYPLGCTQDPTIEGLLNPALRGREQRSLETYMSVSRLAGIPLRIDEAGTVSCGGVAGISDTFASALWATGYIAQAMADGADGVNLQGNPDNCPGYTPLCATSAAASADGILRPQPDWYAMLLTSSLIGYRPLLTTATAEEGAPNLVAQAFAGSSGRLKLVLVDDEPPGSRPLRVRVAVGARLGPARLLRLTGLSLQSTGGVLLGGRLVGAGGEWRSASDLPAAPVRAGALSVLVPAGSAVLVSLESNAQTPCKRPPEGDREKLRPCHGRALLG